MVSLHLAGMPMHVLTVCNLGVGVESYYPDWNKDCVPHCLGAGGQRHMGNDVCSRSERMSNAFFRIEAWHLQTQHYQELAVGCSQEMGWRGNGGL